ncbi:MAG: NAD(P)H-binding protein [Alkalispirochaeta sp.]
MKLLVRDPARSPDLPGTEIAIGDYSDPESLDRACRGITNVFLVSGHAPEGERAQLHRNVIEAAE